MATFLPTWVEMERTPRGTCSLQIPRKLFIFQLKSRGTFLKHPKEAIKTEEIMEGDICKQTRTASYSLSYIDLLSERSTKSFSYTYSYNV